jgi:hypothetical protein
MESSFKIIRCLLLGVRPLMFDRYAGDNQTQLPVAEKMYLDPQRRLIMPSVNIYSLLVSENTKSVCRQFLGKQGKTIALGIASYTRIDPFEIPICDEGGPIVFEGFGDRIYVHKSVARLKGGIPNPKERPTLSLPWKIEFTINYQDNKHCTLENLRQAITMGGTLGLGTFRPFFGRYEVAAFDVT